MSKVAIYCRLSDEDRGKINNKVESESIENQKDMLVEYAQCQGWQIYKIYADDDYSGLDQNRPQFKSMIKAAEEKKFDIIICKSQSRFTRDMEQVEGYLHNKFLHWGIRFITLVDGVDSENKGNKKSRQINGLVNEWYCEDISEAIKATFRIKQQKGKFIGAFSPYGYKKSDKDKNQLIIDEEAAGVVKLIFELYMKGYGTKKIANILNEKVIKNPAEYKKSKGYRFHSELDSGQWCSTTIRRTLKNEIYIGNMVQHKREKLSYKSNKILNLTPEKWTVVKDTHQGIIEKDTFEKVNKILGSKRRASKPGRAHFLAGLVYCRACGGKYLKSSNGKGIEYLRCKNKGKGKLCCNSNSIRLDMLSGVIVEKINKHLKTFNVEQIAMDIICEGKKRITNDVYKEINSINNKIEENNAYLMQVYKDRTKEVIYEETFLSLLNAYKEESNELNRSLKILKERVEKGKSSNYCSKEKLLSEEVISLIAKEIIERIEVGQKQSTNIYSIKIFWKF